MQLLRIIDFLENFVASPTLRIDHGIIINQSMSGYALKTNWNELLIVFLCEMIVVLDSWLCFVLLHGWILDFFYYFS